MCNLSQAILDNRCIENFVCPVKDSACRDESLTEIFSSKHPYYQIKTISYETVFIIFL